MMRRTATKAAVVQAVLASMALGGWAACKTNEPSKPAARPLTATPIAAPAPTAPGAADVADKGAALKDPSLARATAPSQYKVKFATTKGSFIVEVHRDWAPLGADRFYNLVKIGYFEEVAFFRVVKGFMAQFGIHGDPAVNAVWRQAHLQDDPPGRQSNTRGTLTFATAGPDTRTVQLFINYADNARLDGMGFTPVGKIIEGMDVVDALEGEYGEGQPMGRGPAQGRLQAEGNQYLKSEYPKLDYIKSATLL